jgi:hypothetical protein
MRTGKWPSPHHKPPGPARPREGAIRALVCREHAKDAVDLQTRELNIDLLPLYCRRDDHIPVPIFCDWICYRSVLTNPAIPGCGGLSWGAHISRLMSVIVLTIAWINNSLSSSSVRR